MRPARRTSPFFVAVIVATGLVVGRLLPPLTVRLDSATPPVPGWGAAVVLVCGAVAVGAVAWATWQNIHRRHRVIATDHAIRLLALAKASITVGGVFAGGYAGYALAYLGASSDLGHDRFWRSAAASAAAVALLVAGLVLEWACKLPSDGEDEEKTSADADPSPA